MQLVTVGAWFMLAIAMVLLILDYAANGGGGVALAIKLVFLVGGAVIWRMDREQPTPAVVDGWFIIMLVAVALFGSI